MCQFKSGIAVRIDESTIRIHTLPCDDSHQHIRDAIGIRDTGDLSRNQTPVELVAVRGLAKIDDFDFTFDDARPYWWTDTMTEQAKYALFAAAQADLHAMIFSGSLYLGSLTSLPEGVEKQFHIYRV